jgi:hypothetical protein
MGLNSDSAPLSISAHRAKQTTGEVFAGRKLFPVRALFDEFPDAGNGLLLGPPFLGRK